MLLNASKKNFAVFALLLLISGAGCRFFQSSNSNTPKPFTPEEIKSDIPFSTKEPEIFQMEIVITSTGTENKKFIARSRNSRRFDYNFGAKNQVSVVQADKIYTILADKKIYTETAFGQNFPAQNDWTSEWLNAKTDAEFTKIGTENNLTQYRVSFGETAKSEMLIFVDETLQMPIKQEFYSLENGLKTLTMTIELRNFKAEAASDLFAVPKDFKKVAAEEFKRILSEQPA
jgi:hypothetical protein